MRTSIFGIWMDAKPGTPGFMSVTFTTRDLAEKSLFLSHKKLPGFAKISKDTFRSRSGIEYKIFEIPLFDAVEHL